MKHTMLWARRRALHGLKIALPTGSRLQRGFTVVVWCPMLLGLIVASAAACSRAADETDDVVLRYSGNVTSLPDGSGAGAFDYSWTAEFQKSPNFAARVSVRFMDKFGTLEGLSSLSFNVTQETPTKQYVTRRVREEVAQHLASKSRDTSADAFYNYHESLRNGSYWVGPYYQPESIRFGRWERRDMDGGVLEVKEYGPLTVNGITYEEAPQR